MLGRTNTGGGGGLNFRVIGGTSAPSSPKENDIWVNTDVKIASYIFSVTEPKNPVEGMVWISTDTSSPIEFNALKKNSIQVYPISAKQYVNGALVEVVAKSYQNGEWLEWVTDVYIFKRGIGATGTIETRSQAHATIVVSVDGITVDWSGSQGYTFSNAWSQETYDVSDFSALVVESNFTDTSAVYVGLKSGGGDVSEKYQFSAYGTITKTGKSTIEVDIQHLTGEHGFAYMGKAKGTMYNIYLKK